MKVISHYINAPGYGMMKAVVDLDGDIMDLESINSLPDLRSEGGFPVPNWQVRLGKDLGQHRLYIMGWIHPMQYYAITDKDNRVVWQGQAGDDEAIFSNGKNFFVQPLWVELKEGEVLVVRHEDCVPLIRY